MKGKTKIARKRSTPGALRAPWKPSKFSRRLNGPPDVIVPRNAAEATELITYVAVDCAVALERVLMLSMAFDGAMAGIKEYDLTGSDAAGHCEFLRVALDHLHEDMHRIDMRVRESARVLYHARKRKASS